MKKKKEPQAAQRLSPDVLGKVRARAVALASPHGLEVRDVTFGPTDLGLTLSVLLASAEGKALSVTDCEMIARPLSKELDDLLDDRTPPYMFEVASVGVDPEPLEELDEDQAL
jgi:ribosome maturation factor RimP